MIAGLLTAFFNNRPHCGDNFSFSYCRVYLRYDQIYKGKGFSKSATLMIIDRKLPFQHVRPNISHAPYEVFQGVFALAAFSWCKSSNT